MLVTAENLNLEFIEDIDELQRLIDEYRKLDTAIEESVHYKLLAGKTQVLARGKGVTKKERSRGEHTKNLENLVCKRLVEEIFNLVLEANPNFNDSEEAKKIFELNRELTVRKSICIAKAHDIGHVAYAHEGERSINDYFKGLDVSEVMEILNEHRAVFGDEYETEQGHISHEFATHTFAGKAVSFEHNELSALLFNQIIENNGINLPEKDCKELILGILAHSTSKVRKYDLIKGNLSAQVVRAGDKVEYRNADYDELRVLIEKNQDMPIDIVQYLRMHLVDRINKTSKELAKEAVKRGRIWETRSGLWDSEPVMEKLFFIKRAYEDILFLFDSSYSYHLLKDELFPRLSDFESLQQFYEDNPGIDVFYPKDKVKEIFYKIQDLENRAKTGINPSLDDEIWKDTIPFKSVLQGENSERIYSIYQKVLDYYYNHPEQIPNKVIVTISPINRIGDQGKEILEYTLNPKYKSRMQRTLEYISLLDDEAMMQKYKELVEERIERGPGYGIEPVTAEDMKKAIFNSYNASVKKFAKSLGTYSLEEAEKIYIQRGNQFYSEGLTATGKKVYKQYYRKRFAEYAEDQELVRRVQEADRAKGIVADDEESGFECVEAIEKDAHEQTIFGDKIGYIPSRRLSKGLGTYKQPRKVNSFVRVLGILGQKLTAFSEERQKRYIKRIEPPKKDGPGAHGDE